MRFTFLLLLFLASIHIPAQEFNGNRTDIDAILRQSERWSEHYVNESLRGLAELYTDDGKILPNGADIIEGREAIAEHFKMKEGYSPLSHTVQSEEITICGEYAYDYGYYQGTNENARKEQNSFSGKYVIIWKKLDGKWLIYVDIWNAVVQE